MPRCLAAFSLIEMMIAIVILGLGLVMTATMFPVAWTRARTLTEYTTQRAIAQSAAATIAETVRPSGSTFYAFTMSGSETGKNFLSSAGLAGDLIYDSVLHSDPGTDPAGNPLKLPCAANQCYTHLSVLIPSDTRVHALNMENLNFAAPAGNLPAENPFAIERINMQGANRVDLCDNNTPKESIGNYPIPNYAPQCAKPTYAGEPNGAQFCARSFYSPQVGVGARMYPPLENPPSDPSAQAAFSAWLDKFNNRRFAWAALHRLRSPVGPTNVPPGALPATESTLLASQAAQAAGTTRVFDFYIVMLKRPQPTSRYAVQDDSGNSTPNPADRTVIAAPIAKVASNDRSLPVAWRVQLEIPATLISKYTGASTGVPAEVQFPPQNANFGNADDRGRFSRMLPVGAQFVDEVNGQIFRITRRRESNDGFAFLTLDRELIFEDFDDGDNQGNPPTLDTDEILRPIWIYPPSVDRSGGTDTLPIFENSTPVVGIDVKTISMTPPG